MIIFREVHRRPITGTESVAKSIETKYKVNCPKENYEIKTGFSLALFNTTVTARTRVRIMCNYRTTVRYKNKMFVYLCKRKCN